MEWRSGQALRGKAHRDAACGNAANRRLKMPMARRRIASDFSVLAWFLLPHGQCGVLMNPESSADASPQAQEISATRLIKKRIYFFVVLPIVVAGLALFAEFWIKYPASDAILALLEALVNKPRRARMPGYLVTSESNNGKTSIAMRFAGLHPPVFSEADNKMQMPVMLLEVVPTPTEAAIIERILSILGIPYRLTDPVPDKREAAIVAMRNAGLQLLMLDELQKILGARLEQRRAVMDALRYIANQVPVPVVAFSTPRGTGGLASSDEMINRLRPLTLPTWKLDADFQRLLLSFEEHMPLPERSGLGKKAMAALIHTLSEGLVGEVYDLLELALSVAIASDAPRIDEALLRGLAWTPPSDRKRLARAATP